VQQSVPPKRRLTQFLHGATFQKMAFFLFKMFGIPVENRTIYLMNMCQKRYRLSQFLGGRNQTTSIPFVDGGGCWVILWRFQCVDYTRWLQKGYNKKVPVNILPHGRWRTRTVELEETAVARKRHINTFPWQRTRDTTIGELLETVFWLRPCRIYAKRTNWRFKSLLAAESILIRGGVTSSSQTPPLVEKKASFRNI
jgi:hypothetical protein